ncbi:hypothetical protein BSLA_02r0008 [Burkholderia stabilis]|nr:hypothetical protein BSLA_02r0008 [Burkholderia stabilis]
MPRRELSPLPFRIEAQDLERAGARTSLDWVHQLSSWIHPCARRFPSIPRDRTAPHC